MFPIELIEAVKYLQQRVSASGRHEDGRVNSIDDEDAIIDELIAKYGTDNIQKPEKRCWYDVMMWGYPVNIKSSKMTNADNCISTKVMLYVFTEAELRTGWKYFYTSMRCEKQETGRNYFFIVLDKNTGKVYLQSLRTLQKLTPNGSNLPFQIRWCDNLEPQERTWQESYDMVTGALKASVRALLSVHQDYNSI